MGLGNWLTVFRPRGESPGFETSSDDERCCCGDGQPKVAIAFSRPWGLLNKISGRSHGGLACESCLGEGVGFRSPWREIMWIDDEAKERIHAEWDEHRLEYDGLEGTHEQAFSQFLHDRIERSMDGL